MRWRRRNILDYIESNFLKAESEFSPIYRSVGGVYRFVGWCLLCNGHACWIARVAKVFCWWVVSGEGPIVTARGEASTRVKAQQAAQAAASRMALGCIGREVFLPSEQKLILEGKWWDE